MEDLSALGALESDPMNLLIFKLPPDAVAPSEFQEAFVIPVLTRRSGFMAALPLDFLPEELLTAGDAASQDDVIGPSLAITVPGCVEEDDGEEHLSGHEIGCLLVDFHVSALPLLRRFNPSEDGQGVQFVPGEIEVLPTANSLLEKAKGWLQEGPEDRVAFYSAEEGVPMTPPHAVPLPKRKATPKAKVTMAMLAEQLSSLAATLPGIS